MASEIICLDTSILIDYYRKKNKSKTLFYQLTNTYSSFAVSVITEYEIYIGSNIEQDKFWDEFFKYLLVLPFNSEVNQTAIKIARELKAKRKQLAIPDLLIGATALTHRLTFATLNKMHFEWIDNLEIIT